MLPILFSQNLAKAALRHPGKSIAGHDAGRAVGSAKDTVAFAGGTSSAQKPAIDFWASVKRAALGGKHASGWRKAAGWITYPYQLVKHAALWLFGKTSGFKTLHPLKKETSSQLMDRIERLNKELPSDLRFGFSAAEVEAAGIHKNHLLKVHDSLAGLKALLGAKDWPSTAAALEQFLSANGKNNSKSCANISFTHAQKLSTGAPMKARKLPVALVTYDKDQSKKIFLGSAAYDRASEVEKQHLVNLGEKHFLQSFGIRGGVEPTTIESVENALQKAGSGAQALLFDLKGDQGHVTLAVNLKGRIYHVDNLNTQSAKVSELKDWFQEKDATQLWYGRLKNDVHPAIR